MGDGHLLVRQETPARKSRCLPATSRGVALRERYHPDGGSKPVDADRSQA